MTVKYFIVGSKAHPNKAIQKINREIVLNDYNHAEKFENTDQIFQLLGNRINFYEIIPIEENNSMTQYTITNKSNEHLFYDFSTEELKFTQNLKEAAKFTNPEIPNFIMKNLTIPWLKLSEIPRDAL